VLVLLVSLAGYFILAIYGVMHSVLNRILLFSIVCM